jgi:hypothetical protein
MRTQFILANDSHSNFSGQFTKTVYDNVIMKITRSKNFLAKLSLFDYHTISSPFLSGPIVSRYMSEVDQKLLKSAKKEGSKLGIDLVGASEMGGTEFFCTTIVNAEGNFEILTAAKDAMLEELTASVGVILVSAGVPTLSAWCVVPEDKADVVPADEWLGTAVKAVGGELHSGATKTHASAVINPKEGEFAIKLKDAVIAAALNVLRAKGKLADDSDSGDDICFGDDDLGNF